MIDTLSAGTVAEKAPPGPYTLIVNPTAGGGRAASMISDVERQFDARRAIFRVERTRSAEHGVDLAFEAIDANEIPVVMSGDGLIGMIGGALAGVDRPIGIIPAGRGNDLARNLGIPTDAAGAVECLTRGNVRVIDVGEANDRRFLGVASVGFDSDANRIANDARFIKGSLVYAYAALRALLGWKPVRFTLVEGERRSRFTGYTVVVANNCFYGGGMMIAPHAVLDDGELDVVTIGEVSKMRFLLNLPKVFKGTHVDDQEDVREWRTHSIEISASRDLTVYADGDPVAELPAKIRILPSALKVIAPLEPGA